MVAANTKSIHDLIDTRREPATLRYCVICQRDLKPQSPCYEIRLYNNEPVLIHPSKWVEADAWMQQFQVGPECIKKIGHEWARPSPAITQS